ncbi:hypothetical protein K439DRAFT_1624863 [Ramaria rubella]|nr:hypothetical protein K439DRAFT_1624863 [Ramaria rubella]
MLTWESINWENRAILKGSDLGEIASVDLELSFVGKVSTSNFWMLPDAGWTGKPFPDSTMPVFSKVKSRMALIAPRLTPWKDDLAFALKAMQWIEDNEGNSQGKQGLFRDSLHNAIKVVHTLFTVHLAMPGTRTLL